MLELNLRYDVAVLIVTRGRTDALERAVRSLVDRASVPEKIQLLFAFDQDDNIGYSYFDSTIKHWLNDNNISFSVLLTPRYGYTKLHHYGNLLAKMADAEWCMFWNDDALMDTDGWDREIAKYNGKFCILSVMAHNEHPYSIFPIVPHMWVRLLGHLTRHQQIDHEVSQMAYLLDIFQRIPVHVTHDRADITGNNNDETYKNSSSQYDNNDPSNPDSFYHPTYCNIRQADIEQLAQYMRYLKMDTSWWDNFKAGKNPEPFSKLADNDTNFQTVAGQARLKKLLAEAEAKKAEAEAEQLKDKTNKKKKKVK